MRLPEPKMTKIVEEIRTKFQLFEFTNFVCYLSSSCKEVTLAMNKCVSEGLKNFQSKRYRQFFILFEKLINVQD